MGSFALHYISHQVLHFITDLRQIVYINNFYDMNVSYLLSVCVVTVLCCTSIILHVLMSFLSISIPDAPAGLQPDATL